VSDLFLYVLKIDTLQLVVVILVELVFVFDEETDLLGFTLFAFLKVLGAGGFLILRSKFFDKAIEENRKRTESREKCILIRG
jgi:hypothetical protein